MVNSEIGENKNGEVEIEVSETETDYMSHEADEVNHKVDSRDRRICSEISNMWNLLVVKYKVA